MLGLLSSSIQIFLSSQTKKRTILKQTLEVKKNDKSMVSKEQKNSTKKIPQSDTKLLKGSVSKNNDGKPNKLANK